MPKVRLKPSSHLAMASLLLVSSCMSLVLLCCQPASAAVTLVRTANNGSQLSATQASFAAAPTTGDLIVAICAANTNSTITGPAGFTQIINQSGTVSQGMFYKISTGAETTVNCTFSGSPGAVGVHIYEYSGIHTYMTLEASGSSPQTTSSVYSSGSVTTTHANDLIIAGIIANVNKTGISSWTNSFIQENNMTSTNGPTSSRASVAGADLTVSSAGTYTTTASGDSAAYLGQIAAFRALPASPALTTDIIDGTGNPVASPSAAMTQIGAAFSCQTSTGTLGSSSQKIHVSNSTDNPAWTLSIAATGGTTATWTSGTQKYDFNDPTGTGCSDGTDTDSLAGQLSVSPASGTITPGVGCTRTGVSQGANTAFSEGSTDAITLMSGVSGTDVECSWDLTGVQLSQKVPAGQNPGSYSLGLTITVVAN